MQKNTILSLALALICATVQSTGVLDTPLDPRTPATTIRTVLTALNETLPAGSQFFLHVIEKTEPILLATYLQKKLNENAAKLDPAAISRAQEVITQITSALAQHPTRQASLRRTKKPMSLIAVLKTRQTTIEARQREKFKKRTQRRQRETASATPAAHPERDSDFKLFWKQHLHPSAPPLSSEDLYTCVDSRLSGLFNTSNVLTYVELIFWIEKKCGMPTDESAFNDLEMLLRTLIVKLEIFLKSKKSKKMDEKDLSVTKTIYGFLKKKDKHWDMWQMGPALSAVDKILAFVKLRIDPKSPVAVSAI